jgi:mannose-6-phosphate isomerase-like protein (cupin superfamily)
VISANRASDATFVRRDTRPTLEFRDLGVAAATEGRVLAQLVKATARSDGPLDRHHHENLEVQFFFVLTGSLVGEYDGVRQEWRRGDCVVQPPGVVHQIVSHSEDLELIEVSLPAAYATILDE